MCDSKFEPSSCDWGMDGYYRQMELRDAEIDAEERLETEMWQNFQKWHDNIMPAIHLLAYEYKNEALNCGQEDYLESSIEWFDAIEDWMEDMDFGLTGWQNEEAREALLYLVNTRNNYLHSSKINEFAKAHKGS
mgnify:CR=1 FL=1|jgi:hypothetical protein|nr:MAG TPA: hypothetical protein [Caudoviricetes sp.]